MFGKSKILLVSVPVTLVLIVLALNEYGLLTIHTDPSELAHLRMAKSATLEKHMTIISQKQQIESALPFLREFRKVHDGKIIKARSAGLATTSLQETVRGIFAEKGGSITTAQAEAPGRLGAFVLVGSECEAVVPGLKALYDILFAIETHPLHLLIRDLDIKTRSRGSSDLSVKIKIAALTDGQ